MHVTAALISSMQPRTGYPRGMAAPGISSGLGQEWRVLRPAVLRPEDCDDPAGQWPNDDGYEIKYHHAEYGMLSARQRARTKTASTAAVRAVVPGGTRRWARLAPSAAPHLWQHVAPDNKKFFNFKF